MTLRPRPALVLGASVLGIFVGFGSLVIFSFGVFLKPVSAEFGWTRTQASLAFTLAALTVAAASPLLGRITDRIGPRRVLLPCVSVYAAALAALAFVHSLAAYYALYVALGLVGNGTAHLCYARIVSSWFDRRRGAALATVMAGAAAGAILIPPISTGLIAHYGWRAAYLLLAASVVTLGLLPAALFVHDAPARRQGTGASPAHPHQPGVTGLSAARSSAFWLLLAGFFLFSLSVNGCVAHLIPMLTDRAVSPETAALAASLLGIFTLSGRLLTGALLDRLPAPPLTTAFFTIAAAGVAILSSAHTRNTAFLGASLTGLGMGAEADVLPYLISRYFGLRSFTEIYRYAFTSYAIAGALGPLLMGWGYDHWRSYLIPTRLLAAAMLASALILALLPRNHPSPSEAAALPIAACTPPRPGAGHLCLLSLNGPAQPLPLPVRGPTRVLAKCRRISELYRRPRSIRVHHIDLEYPAIAIAAENDLLPVRRPPRPLVVSRVVRHILYRPGPVLNEDFVVPGLIRGK